MTTRNYAFVSHEHKPHAEAQEGMDAHAVPEGQPTEGVIEIGRQPDRARGNLM